MKKPLLLLPFVLLSCIAFAQAVVSGKVTDAETQEPLQGASVFAQNTTRGTLTDKDGQFHLQLDKGGYELILSYTGYTSKTINLEVTTEDRQFNVALEKGNNSLSEIVITTSNEVPDGWEKYGKFFLDHFIGSTPLADSCILTNPQALKFFYYKKSDRLKVLATEPLQIENKLLGYHLRYELDSFVQYYKTDLNTYRGHCLYTLMDGDDGWQKLWKANRQKVYFGSRLHFLRSYYDSTLSQQGFTIDTLSGTNSTQFARLSNPYDTAYYFFNDSTSTVELWFPAKVSITYTRKAPEKEYLQQYHLPLKVPVQISYVELTDGIVIQPNGYFSDQKSWISQGYWSWKNLADQLPYDYEPDR
jgi:CarboxypepD_reg-like domain